MKIFQLTFVNYTVDPPEEDICVCDSPETADLEIKRRTAKDPVLLSRMQALKVLTSLDFIKSD